MLEERERRVKSATGVRGFFPPCDRPLTLGHPGSPEAQPVHRTLQQHPFLPRPVPWWGQLSKK